MPAVQHGDDERIEEGKLTCAVCAAAFPILRGIPRFVPAEADYCENFGFQWQRWRSIQVDRLAGHHLSENRFFSSVPWPRTWMRDKLILDVGCGAGRFTDVAAANGATVVACDISGAVEACQQNTRTHGSAVHVVQASVYALPFREGIFDAAFCLGVIQHTPDPSVTIDTIPRYLTPGGLLAYDFYERTHWERHWVPHFLLRRFTPSWPARRLLLFAHFLTALFFIPGWILARVPILRNLLPCLPIAMNAQRELSLAGQYRWTVLDTFDWYGPKFELRQHHREVAMRLTRLGLQDVTSRYGVVNARAPERAAAS